MQAADLQSLSQAMRSQYAEKDDGSMMSIGEVLAKLSRQTETRKPGDGEFLGEDGLIHCSVCGARKQFRAPNPFVEGAFITHSVICACGEKALEAERAQAARARDMAAVDRVRRASLMDERLREATFDKWTPPDENLPICRRYAERFGEMRAKNQGLLFFGANGTGKTFAAACIANALLARRVPVMFTSFARLLSISDSRDEGEAETMAMMSRAHLLVVDDLGVERDTSYAHEKLFGLVDARYRANRPTIYTTNLLHKEMLEEKQLAYRRIFDRVLENCFPIKFTGGSRRVAEAAKRYSEMSRLLCGGDA